MRDGVTPGVPQLCASLLRIATRNRNSGAHRGECTGGPTAEPHGGHRPRRVRARVHGGSDHGSREPVTAFTAKCSDSVAVERSRATARRVSARCAAAHSNTAGSGTGEGLRSPDAARVDRRFPRRAPGRAVIIGGVTSRPHRATVRPAHRSVRRTRGTVRRAGTAVTTASTPHRSPPRTPVGVPRIPTPERDRRQACVVTVPRTRSTTAVKYQTRRPRGGPGGPPVLPSN